MKQPLAKFIFALMLPIVFPAIALLSLAKNLKTGLHYWWLDMRCEVASAKNMFRDRK